MITRVLLLTVALSGLALGQTKVETFDKYAKAALIPALNRAGIQPVGAFSLAAVQPAVSGAPTDPNAVGPPAPAPGTPPAPPAPGNETPAPGPSPTPAPAPAPAAPPA